MGFIKLLIGLPLVVVILVFAFVNNDLATFNLWPFYVEITVSQSVAIVSFVVFGYILGKVSSWMSYAPVRAQLRKQKKENKKLNKEQQKLTEKVSGLQENLEIWHEAGYAVHLAPKLGVREVRRIKGEYVLTANDLIAGTMHDDVIAHAHYSFDVWGMKIPEEMKHIGPYGIPYRSILPTKTEGLLTAGRIISATRIAHSSLRVQPICSNIGMAAGMSALNQTGLRSIDIKQLQDRLASMGLFDGLKKK